MPEVKVTFDAADDYERFMGRWSRAIGEKFLAWLDPPKGARWLDVGCGTGAFSGLIVQHGAPKSVTGIDPAPAQIEHARKSFPSVAFQVADLMDMPFGDDAFDVVASALVIHFIPDRAKAFGEMRRVARPGGLIAAYTWERTATAEFAPYAPMLRALESIGAEALRSPTVPEGNLEGLLASLNAAGYKDIALTKIEATQSFRDFEDFWQTQTLPFSPPGKSVAKLDDLRRGKLREVLRATLPTGKDGSISYPARAVAFKARAPE